MFVRILGFFASTVFVTATLLAADNPMVGTWKLNPAKSKFSGLQEKIKSVGGDKYTFQFGDDVETIALNGKDYPTKFGNTWAVTPTGPFSWKEVDKQNGKVTATATWTLSAGGKLFTSTTDGTRPDGSTYHTVFKAKRVAGSSGLPGTWKSTDLKLSSPAQWVIQSYQGDGISLITAADKERIDLKFDGKDYPDKGPRVAPDTTVSGKRIDERTVEISSKIKGKGFYTERLEVSRNGKRMTGTLRFAGVSQPEVDVYDRQ